MSLPLLLKHIYSFATDDVIRRGKKIFHTSGVYILDNDPLTESITFRVKNDIYHTHYKVTVKNYITADQLTTRCQCPYNMGTVCRHEAAALFQLNELVQSGYFDSINLTYNQKHTNVRMRQATHHYIKLFSGAGVYDDAETLMAKVGAVEITSAENDTVKADVKDGRKTLKVVLSRNEERYFDTSCGCDDTKHALCVHKTALFLWILKHKGAQYFNTLRNWDKEKDKLLALYGFSLEDDLRGKFDFAFHEGRLSLRVLNAGIKKLSDPTHPKNVALAQEIKDNALDETHELILLADANCPTYPFLEFMTGSVAYEDGKPSGHVELPQLGQVLNIITLPDDQRNLANILKRQSSDELIKALKRDTPFGDFIDTLHLTLKKKPKEPLRSQVWDFYLTRFSKLLDQHREWEKVFLLPKGKKLNGENLEHIHFSEDKFTARLYAFPTTKDNDSPIAIELQIVLNENILQPKQYHLLNEAMLIMNSKMYAARNKEVVKVVGEYSLDKPKEIAASKWAAYLKDELLLPDSRIIISFHSSLQQEVLELEPKMKLVLKEGDEKLSLQPLFIYGGIEKKWLDERPAIEANDGMVMVYKRNEATEQTLLTVLRHLHPNMQESRKQAAFLMPAADALKQGWYFQFLDTMKELDVEMEGWQQLKQLRINPNKPVTNLQFTTGIDWFEAEMEIAFGDQTVTIADVKKALSKNKNVVNLKDGSKGLITDEFIDKYGLMIKLGEVEGNTIKIKKVHFAALQNLEEVKDNPELYDELEEKRRKLIDYDYDGENALAIPGNLTAELRPYQEAGYQWLHFLDHTGWGGILADDMGLGKTLQTLSYLQQYYNEKNDAKFLVVCPTTLIFNWQNETEKFTNDIKYHIYHGPNRRRSMDDFKSANLIITTYGTLRSDIDMLSRIEFDYVVLDESQAIKNPVSLVAKSTLKLNAKNRLALSGTPIQNNTFDLYAQMNFLNPGMLGSVDFFKNEFANPIDKMQDENAKVQLRKLIYPFLLRRTKEQVAPDLPEKTEMVIYCEMGTKQRKIYEAYRNRFRSQILGSIEEKGLGGTTMSILTGLMKLRQICDSPAILNDAEQFENHSVKIDELVRELSENVSNHKALIFSQFLGMLDLIRQELEKLSIPYVYFDGSTNATAREAAIQKFQEDDDCKIFLISLKAGGVGLNLTAADYVYIVDPWWNPAVEQQAIDRTHRIGQTKNIFAYRMICKDTIEEKIMLLQQRKLSLAKELIADDAGFIKKLTKEDVEYLLS